LNIHRERQQQIEELTKKLKQTHDEYELLRQKLLQYQNKKGVNKKQLLLLFKYFNLFVLDITLW
jgi:hypothetical protein